MESLACFGIGVVVLLLWGWWGFLASRRSYRQSTHDLQNNPFLPKKRRP